MCHISNELWKSAIDTVYKGSNDVQKVDAPEFWSVSSKLSIIYAKMDYYDTYYFLVTVSHYYVNMYGTVNPYIFFLSKWTYCRNVVIFLPLRSNFVRVQTIIFSYTGGIWTYLPDYRRSGNKFVHIYEQGSQNSTYVEV